MTMMKHPGTGPYLSNDGTWSLPLPGRSWNAHSCELSVPEGCEADFEAGALVRLCRPFDGLGEDTDGAAPTDVLWRVVRVRTETEETVRLVWKSRTTALVVPTDVLASVPAASVRRVEQARAGLAFQAA